MAELTKLGRYELRRVLGKGAMGVVYEGFDPSLNRRVAVKTVLRSVVTDEETAASYSARFAREARAAGRLSHPHIVQVYDFGEENDVAYLAMEFIQGRELRSCFEARQRFDATETVRIMGELLDALEFAHQAGVIHRDVKPANIMLDEQGRVKLADFGVARIQDGTDRSKSGGMVGTPAFMSPEQISGGRLDRRTDVFSAGIVLYQLLTNEVPFKGDGAWTVAKQIMQDEPPRPSTVVGKISPLFDRIVSTALAKRPEHRFESAKDFAAALQGALAGNMESGAQRGNDAEIEFWRAVQNSTDPAEFEAYLLEFPAGLYANLARLKVAKLPRLAVSETVHAATIATQPPSQRSDELAKLAEETAKLEAEIAQREAEYRKREAEAEAKRLAEEKAVADAEARREAEYRKREAEAEARRQAEEKARLAAIEAAKREAEAEAAKREAEYQKREAEAVAKAESEAKVRREIEERARKEAAVRAQVEAEVKARTLAEAQERAKRQAEAQEIAKRQADEFAKRQAEIQRNEEELKRRVAQAPRGQLPVVPASIALLIIAAVAVGGWYWSTSSDEARLAQLTVALEKATKASEELNVARQRQDELRKQVDIARLAEDDARAKGDQAKLKELQEQTKKAEAEAQKQNELVKQREAEAKKADDAAKVADAKKQTEAGKAAAEKAAQEKLAAEKLAQEKAAAEKAVAEKAAAEKASAEKAAAEKLAADKASAEKAAGEKVAVAKAAPRPAPSATRSGMPNVGDRWVYEARDVKHPDKKYEIVVNVLSVGPTGIRDAFKLPSGTVELTHQASATMTGIAPGIVNFVSYLGAFQEVRGGETWSNVEIRNVPCQIQSASTFVSCSASARVDKREAVTVRAGTFNAWKITVEYSLRGKMGGVSGEYSYWYAEEARRVVKHQSRPRSGLDPDMDMELVSYAPATQQAAVQRPAAAKPAAIASPMPNIGDRWTYEVREANHPDRKVPMTVEVLAASSTGIRDTLKVEDRALLDFTHQPVPQLISSGRFGLVEFMPYLQAMQEIRAGQAWPKVDMSKYADCVNGRLTCSGSARIAGREQVSVRAGSFDAWKIEFEFQFRSSVPGFMNITYWYSEEARRYVKSQLRCRNCATTPDTDVELVSYAPAAQSSAAPKGSSSALEQFKLRHSSADFANREPVQGQLREGHILYVDDRSCPEGEIRELTGGNNRTQVPRKSRCVKLTE
jgi:membrane protein involved in colicin uptake